ncbi:MAG: iron-sulfur cluster repair di-iron protein [Terracidiphilus sp.]|nr:iron-sulfur cluster repair di-iron protein [Terracidiphilus sp.]
MLNTTATLRSIALDQPATIRVFERFHLDYCCGGNQPLGEACADQKISTEVVLAELELAAAGATPVKDLTSSSLTEIITEIVNTHHAYVRSELPRLRAMSEKVVAKHGSAHAEVLSIDRMLGSLAEELLQHLSKEELILFPYIEKLERSVNSGNALPHACFASVASPIQAMIYEHESAGELTRQMRATANGYTTPADACATFVGLYVGLDAFERDLHLHIHRENNLLFPRAVEMEKSALAAA